MVEFPEDGVYVTLVDGEVLTIHKDMVAAETCAERFDLDVGFKRWGDTSTITDLEGHGQEA